MTTPAAEPLVHIVVPGFKAIPEFSPGENDACGPTASECCIAACERRDPTVAQMLAIRARDLAHVPPLFTVHGGQTLDELEADVHAYTAIQTTKTPQGSSIEAVHAALKAATLRGNPCVLDLARAGNLPGNEADVNMHFIAIGGINSNQGYLVANGDHAPPTFGPVGTYWVKWPAIAAAIPIGLLEYHMPVPPPPPPPLVDLALEVTRLQAEIVALDVKIAAAKLALG